MEAPVGGPTQQWSFTLLIGQRQSVHGVRGDFGSLVASILVALCGGSGWLGQRQVAKLPRGVGRTPAQVPADATASAETWNLTEDCREERTWSELLASIMGVPPLISQIYASLHTPESSNEKQRKRP